MDQWFYPFDHQHRLSDGELRELLGGKGAGLASMTRLGIPVPPGFTLPTTAHRTFRDGGWTGALAGAIRAGIRHIEQHAGRRLGDPAAPLLVSVRSGAVISMPGMMDTVLNAGVTEDVAHGLADLTGDPSFAWDTYRRGIISYAHVVGDAPLAVLDELESRTSKSPSVEKAALAFGRAVADAGYPVPVDPHEQVIEAAEAVFRSWHSDRASTYRDREGIDHGLGTAVTVQAMVFGNMGERSGTGVAFTRNPSTGEIGLMGDFLPNAQGEDVVAGTHETMPLHDLEARWPEIWAELAQIATTLEHHHADMVDLEFTVEDGRLWLLQSRVGKRSPTAAFRMAVEMADDEDFPVTRAEAVERCRGHLDDPPHLSAPPEAGADDRDAVIATGLAASPGRAVGVVSLDPDDAVERAQRGESVVLVREETLPADVHGIDVSAGLVTVLGGLVSHAAVIARSWGLAAVVGCDGIRLAGGAILTGDRRIEPGTVVTVDGDQGRLLLGERLVGTRPLPEVETIRKWARASDAAGVAPSESTPVSADDCLRLIILKGMTNAEGLVEALGAHTEPIATAISELEERGLVESAPAGRVRPTAAGKALIEDAYQSERSVARLCNEVLDRRFHEPNMALKEVVTAWQVRTVDGETTPNDHRDAGYDAEVLRRLRDDVHTAIGPILADVSAELPRLARYQARLASALDRLAEQDHRYVAHPLLDSYHTVWFELHEELIRLAGRNRRAEAEAGRA